MSNKNGNTKKQKIVIKIGTSTLTDEQGRVDLAFIKELADQVSILQTGNYEVLIVTSGAIIAGLNVLDMPSKRPDDMQTLQAAAAVGQVELIKQYAHAFETRGLRTAQVLLTRNDISNREAYLHARDTLQRLIELSVIPIINENDTVAVEEIRFGDNDTLAAQVAILIAADLVILLSDIEGLYSTDPRIDEDAELIRHIEGFTEEIVAAAGDTQTSKGSGGMVTKLEAARQLLAAGIPMVICEGHQKNVIIDVVSGEPIGTRFAGQNSGHSKARKLWNALSGSVKGSVVVDDGAAKALRERGSSLLPVGIIRVDGDFSKGDIIDIRIQSGFLIGRGVTRYSAENLNSIIGRSSEELADSGAIDASLRFEVMHRDEMVVF